MPILRLPSPPNTPTSLSHGGSSTASTPTATPTDIPPRTLTARSRTQLTRLRRCVQAAAMTFARRSRIHRHLLLSRTSPTATWTPPLTTPSVFPAADRVRCSQQSKTRTLIFRPRHRRIRAMPTQRAVPAIRSHPVTPMKRLRLPTSIAIKKSLPSPCMSRSVNHSHTHQVTTPSINLQSDGTRILAQQYKRRVGQCREI